jgi:hypothetical protein
VIGKVIALAAVSGAYIGLDRFLLPLLGPPWKAPSVDTKAATLCEQEGRARSR